MGYTFEAVLHIIYKYQMKIEDTLFLPRGLEA